MSPKKAFLVNSDRCIGCHACELACKNEYQLEPAVRWRKVYPFNRQGYGIQARTFASLACNHCENPACLKACPVTAYTKRPDGIVLHDQKRCIGCKMCVMACPYKVPQYNAKLQKVEKCHMCAQRQDEGKPPACVQGCPMEALSVIDLDSDEGKFYPDDVPGFPDIHITRPTTRFVRPKVGAQVRRDG